MIPACVIAGIDAFGSSCRVTTCQRNSPLPGAVRTNEAEPTSIERGAQDPHRYGRDADPERERGKQRRLDRADRVALERDVSLRRKHVELHAEGDDQRDPDDERGDRDPDGGEGGEDGVEVAVRPDRARHATRARRSPARSPSPSPRAEASPRCAGRSAS